MRGFLAILVLLAVGGQAELESTSSLVEGSASATMTMENYEINPNEPCGVRCQVRGLLGLH